MDRSRHEQDYKELEEFEKLLFEIPNVTSGSDYNNLFPTSLSSSRPSPFNKKAAEQQEVTSVSDYNHFPTSFTSRRSSPFSKKAAEQYFPQDYAFNRSSDEANLNFGFQDQTVETPHSMFVNPSYHAPNSSPCVYDKYDLRTPDPLMLRTLQQLGYSPAQPQHYLPPMQPPSHYQSHMNWRNIEEENFQRFKLQEEQYLSMNPHLLHPHNNNQITNTAQSQEHFNYPRGGQFNRNLYWNEEDDGDSLRNLDRARKMCCPENIVMRSQLDGAVDDSQSERLWLQNQSIEDLTLNFNNLSFHPPKYNSLVEARGLIYYLAKDQHGCRFLQKFFDEKDEADIEMIFNEIIVYISELMIDPFGNYLVQKMLEVCRDDQRMNIVHSITRNPRLFIKISCDMHGTRAVQKIIEMVNQQEEISAIISGLIYDIVTLIKNVNGNHVVQRCLQYLLPHCGKFLFEAAITHCVDLATDKHGCCVLQSFLDYSEGEQKHHLVSEIASNALLLSQDPYGNYVLQYVFDLHLQWATYEILEQLEGNYTELAMQKCSSNVVEKCLKLADDRHRGRIIRELINYGGLQLMLDPFGNYVIQAALSQTKGILHAALVSAIKVHSSSLRTNPYGKKVLAALNSKK